MPSLLFPSQVHFTSIRAVATLAPLLLALGAEPSRPTDLLDLPPSTVGDEVPSEWRTRAVRGQDAPASAIIDSGGERFLRVRGRDRAGWFVREVSPQLAAGTGQLEWSWRVPVAPDRADLRAEATDDAALRVFVAFGPLRRFGRAPRTIVYSLGGPEPEGYARVGFASKNVYVVRVGTASAARTWTTVRPDPFADYRRAWGEEPPAIAVVGLLQDTDQTEQEAVADLRTLRWIPR